MACDHAITERAVQVHVVLASAVLDEGVDLDEGIRVQQRVDALSGGLAPGLSQFPEAGPVPGAVSGLTHGVELVAARVRHGSAKCEPVHQQDGAKSRECVGRVLAEQVLLPALRHSVPALITREQVVQFDQSRRRWTQ